jgi:hypothetical protein
MPNAKETLREQAKKAAQRETIHPKVVVPDEESQTGSIIVRFKADEPKLVTNPKPIPGRSAEFHSWLVDVLQSDFEPAGENRTLNAGPGSTLGDGILKLWMEHGEKLKGRIARIDLAYPYIAKIKKNARVYNVSGLPDSWAPQ